VLWTLAINFAVLSIFAVGGANVALPEMHRLSVDVMHWMSDRQFADAYALAQLTPGPNVVIVALIGYRVAGVLGGLVAIAAMTGPTCLLAFAVTRIWDRFKGARWRAAIQNGLVPVTLGLMAASAFVVTRAADHNWVALAVTAATAMIASFTRINPLWAFAIGAAIGLAGYL
jgi:chromate transporter